MSAQLILMSAHILVEVTAKGQGIESNITIHLSAKALKNYWKI